MIEISPIPAFKDNYIWLLRAAEKPLTQQSNIAVVVDPGDATPVLKTLRAQNLQLAAILITHHHWDHVNGIDALLEYFEDVEVYGPSNSPVNSITNRLKDNDTFDLPGNLGNCSVLSTPGHTLDHICYRIDKHLFCGDTLFAAGCGRLFEGSAEQMLSSLNKLTSLPTNTHIYPTHEYTLANLHFAMEVEADNTAIAQRLEQTKRWRQENKPSLPSNLQLELDSNPFLRCDKSTVKARVEQHAKRNLLTPAKIFRELRLWKDSY